MEWWPALGDDIRDIVPMDGSNPRYRQLECRMLRRLHVWQKIITDKRWLIKRANLRKGRGAIYEELTPEYIELLKKFFNDTIERFDRRL